MKLGERQRIALDVLRGSPDGVDTSDLKRDGVGPQTPRPGSPRWASSRCRGAASIAIRSSWTPQRPSRRRRTCLTDEQSAAFNRLATLADTGGFHPARAPRRDRQRQDGDLSASRRVRPGAGPGGAAAGAGDCADAGDRVGVPPRLRRSRRDPAQRALRRRASRSMAAHPPRRRRRRRRHALGGVRAAARPRADHRRRGARRLVQAGGEPALSRPRRRGDARPAGRARWSCSGRRRRRSRATTTPSTAATRWSRSTRRVLDRPLAEVRVVDMREEYAGDGPGRDPQRAAVRVAVAAAGGRASRRSCCSTGAASRRRSFCRQCGATLECPNCSLSLTVHRAVAARAAAITATTPCRSRRRARVCGGAVPRAGRLRHRAGRGGGARALPGRAGRPRRSRHDAPARRDRRAAGAVRRGASRRAGRHADAREGARLSEGHAGRRDLGGRRARAWPISAPPSGRFSC